MMAHPRTNGDSLPPSDGGAHLSGERRAVRRNGVEPDIELACVSRQKLARLYHGSLKPGRLVLPGDATTKRGSVSIRLYLSDSTEMWLHGEVSEVDAGEGIALVAKIPPLSDIQHAKIRATLRRPSILP